MTRRTPRNQSPDRPWIVALVLVAIAAGVALGLALNRSVGPQPALPETPAVPTATRVRIEAGGRLNLEIETPLPRMMPPAEPRLNMRLDIRDTETEQPVRGDVWLLIGDQEQLVAENVSIVEFPMPEAQGTATVIVRAPGYAHWALTFNYKAKYDRLLPLPVRMELLPQPPQQKQGGGA
ncbi:MAG: hypothetical protein GY792_05565 [Gammaproteobacteria bacterium]|nr:hypothetical protein [Gammaproteobacteria bacterium]